MKPPTTSDIETAITFGCLVGGVLGVGGSLTYCGVKGVFFGAFCAVPGMTVLAIGAGFVAAMLWIVGWAAIAGYDQRRRAKTARRERDFS